MAKFYLQISDGAEAEVEIEADNAHEALNDGLNALATFACRNFPPPDNVAITVQDRGRNDVARMRLAFEIEYADAVTM